MREEHAIPVKSKCYFEKAFIDGKPVASYICLRCYDRYLEDRYDLEYIRFIEYSGKL